MSLIFEHIENPIQFNDSIIDSSKNYFWSEIINQSNNEQKNNLNIIIKDKIIEPISVSEPKYYLLKKLGKGSSSKVYLGIAFDSLKYYNLKYYSIKVLEKSEINYILYDNEVKLLQKISHKNITKLCSYGEGTQKNYKKNSSKSIYFIITEYYENFDLLKYIFNIEKNINLGFGEDLAKLIFSQLLDGLEFMHDKNIYHRDIKPNNIMLGDDNYTLKYIDIGFGKEKSDKLNEFLGTPAYSAPELYLKKLYYGKSIDIFSLGVTLFVLVTGCLPFKQAEPKDNLYQYFIKGEYVNFWKKRNVNVSPNFMELFDNMVAFDYTQRPSISEIRQSAWMKDINYDLIPYLKEEFILRKQKIKQNEINTNKKLKKTKEDSNQNEETNCHSILDIKKDENNKSNDISNNKGMINIKTKYKNLNVTLVKIKKYFKELGYVANKHDYNNYEVEITNGEIDIVLKIKKSFSNKVKLFFFQTKGIAQKFELFKKHIKYLVKNVF